jgi:integrase/recombinase XerD
MLAVERGAARLTLAAYRNDLDQLENFLKQTSLERASSDDLRRYFAKLAKQGLSARTAARRLSSLRQFYRFMTREGA